MSAAESKLLDFFSGRESREFARKLLAGQEVLRGLGDADIDVGTAPKEAVYHDGRVTLYRYTPVVPAGNLLPPVLIVYGLVSRYYMIDLQPDRSLVRRLLERGVDLYVIDWGYPTRIDRWMTFEDHIDVIADCADVVAERHDLDRINVLGICQGGVFSLCYAALYPQRVQNLIAMVTPVDFAADTSLIARLARSIDVDLLVDSMGNVPGSFMHEGFMMRSMFGQNIQKYANLMDLFDEREQLVTFLRMEKWIHDSPDHPGEAFRKWFKEFYQQNRLIDGTLELDGKRVSLRNLSMPVLNLYGDADDIIAPPSSVALERYAGTKDYTARAFPVGHIGMYVSSKVQRELPQLLAQWLGERR
jgi:polyhydroxyalkanoate synthase